MSEFEELVRRHQAAVCATAYAMLRDRGRSEEIAQDAFLVAWRKLPSLSPPPPMPAFICGIARNLARNAIRKRREVAMDEPPDPSSTTTPLDQALSREQVDLANRALATLSDADREVVVLYYRADESISAVAAALEIAEPAARKRLQRTRERLRDALASVETTLRQTRPGPAFTVACIAALAAGRAVDASAAPSTAKPALLLVAGALVLVGGAFAVRVATHPSSHAPAPAGSSATTSTVVGSATPAPPSGRAAATRDFIEKISAADRAAVLSRVHAKDVPAAPAIPPLVYDFSGSRLDDTTPPKPPLHPERLDKASVRYAIRLMLPMLRDCATDRTPKGTIEVMMHLDGDASSTIVESIEVSGKAPLSEDTEFTECVRTTLQSLELPPRDDLTRPWDVNYPFTR